MDPKGPGRDEVLRLNRVNKIYAGGAHAVKDVYLSIARGECLGLVGESGSGKSTLARCLLALERIDSGEIWLEGEALHDMPPARLYQARQRMQVVFQNPTASLNSKLTIRESLMEPIRCQGKGTPSFCGACRGDREIAARLMELVHLPADVLDRFPRELSGGQKQRVCIARAISVEPTLVVLDEPTASLDVSIQARVLNLLKDLQEELSLSYLFISHDLSAVQFMSTRLIVMYEGQIVDRFTRDETFSPDRHAYTKKLIEIFDV
jgi:ATPase components of various ABC-type transport systems, contain duplicated ATPase